MFLRLWQANSNEPEQREPAPGARPERMNSFQRLADFGGDPTDWTGLQFRMKTYLAGQPNGIPMKYMDRAAEKSTPIDTCQIPEQYQQANSFSQHPCDVDEGFGGHCHSTSSSWTPS